MYRAIAVWHSPAVKPGEPDYFLAVDAAGETQSIFSLRGSKRWSAMHSSVVPVGDKGTITQLSVVLRAAQDNGVQLELHAVDAPNLPAVRLSAMVGNQHVASVLLTQAEWSRIRSRISTS